MRKGRFWRCGACGRPERNAEVTIVGSKRLCFEQERHLAAVSVETFVTACPTLMRRHGWPTFEIVVESLVG